MKKIKKAAENIVILLGILFLCWLAIASVQMIASYETPPDPPAPTVIVPDPIFTSEP